MHKWRGYLFAAVLVALFFFIAFGNFFRLIRSSIFPDSFLISEGCVEILSCLALVFLRGGVSHILTILPWGIGIFLSFLYGMHLQGYDFIALLYAARLFAVCIAIYVLKEILIYKYAYDIEAVCLFFLRPYVIALGLGIGMYVFFPQSNLLWLFLEEHHVGFRGDPHIGRFVSVYFDPNYYSVIAIFPFLLSVYLAYMKRRYIYGVIAGLLAVSIILTWSRSGIALFLCVGCCLAGTLRYSYLMLRLLPWCMGILGVCCLIYHEEIQVFFSRIFGVWEDDSALCRLRTFSFGIDLVREHPWWGIGVNFLQQKTIEGIGLNSLDSSLLSLLVQIGIIPFSLLIGYFGWRVLFLCRCLRAKAGALFPFWKIYGVYVLGVIVFASQWNNLLFYPFWILPIGACSAFLMEALLHRQETILGVCRVDQVGDISSHLNDCLCKRN